MTNQITWSDEEFKEFDRLTMMASSPHQVTRIEGRLNLQEFVEKHGEDKCHAMFEHLSKEENDNDD